MVSTKNLTCILSGPTASGKTEVANWLCNRCPHIEIINADSIQVYKGFDIGSAKPSKEERKQIPHHLIDFVDPTETFTAADFVRATWNSLEEIRLRGKRAIIVGGTGFYLKALLFGMWDTGKSDPELRKQLESKSNQDLFMALKARDPKTAEKIHLSDHYRLVRALEAVYLTGKTVGELEKTLNKEPNPNFKLLIIDREKEELNERILKRAKEMVDVGLVQEVTEHLRKHPDAKPLRSVGYAQTVDFLLGKKPKGRLIASGEEGLIQEIGIATRQMVKNQRTWFRSQKSSTSFLLEQDREKLHCFLEKIYS